VNKLLIGLLVGVATAFAAVAASNTVVPAMAAVPHRTNAPSARPDPNNPVEKEYKKLMEDDDAAQAEVDRWLRDNEQFAATGAGVPDAEMKRRIQERLKPIHLAYEQFLKRHPDHAGAHVAYGSFLNDMHDEEGAEQEWKKALALDPRDPAVYNNLANVYGHVGPVKKAFEYYAKAIELNPEEAIYYHNFGTTVFLFRKDAREYYGITEQQVFDKALELYSHALRLDPTNFPLASDVAQTYYGIRPLRLEDALKAWTNTLAIAHDETEREGVYIHFARLKLLGKRFDEARVHLNAVTNDMYTDLKKRLVRNLSEQEKQAKETNAPPAATETEVQNPNPEIQNKSQ
jgi:tetratricopeptide (TPR) repeat protein